MVRMSGVGCRPLSFRSRMSATRAASSSDVRLVVAELDDSSFDTSASFASASAFACCAFKFAFAMLSWISEASRCLDKISFLRFCSLRAAALGSSSPSESEVAAFESESESSVSLACLASDALDLLVSAAAFLRLAWACLA